MLSKGYMSDLNLWKVKNGQVLQKSIQKHPIHLQQA